jgi:hypothetical protein
MRLEVVTRQAGQAGRIDGREKGGRLGRWDLTRMPEDMKTEEMKTSTESGRARPAACTAAAAQTVRAREHLRSHWTSLDYYVQWQHFLSFRLPICLLTVSQQPASQLMLS